LVTRPFTCGRTRMRLPKLKCCFWPNRQWTKGASGDTVGRDTALQTGRSRVQFFVDIILLGSTQLLKEMSKGGRCVGLTTLPLSCANCREILGSQPPGNLRTCPRLYTGYFLYLFYNGQNPKPK